MKKIFLFAAAAALMAACSSEELSYNAPEQTTDGDAINFSIYTPRSVTRAGEAGIQTTKTVGDASKSGFGVFGYYTNGEDYATANTFPNFMYNQRVKGDGNGTSDPVKWTYEPVKYWPNEYGNAATSDDIDRLTFFSYAPWTEVTPSTGIPAVENITDYNAFVAGLNIKLGGAPALSDVAGYQAAFGYATVDEAKAALDDINKELIQGKNITQMTRNTAIGDPIIKYVVDTNPVSSVDLLWGVCGVNDYKTTWGGIDYTVAKGAPFIDIVKPNDPTGATGKDKKVVFNLRHALAKLLVTIDYKDDTATPGTTGTPASNKLNNEETKIFVREIKIGGFVMKGALNLNNGKTPATYAADDFIPNWMAYDGSNELIYEPVTFKDGRRDGKEGAADGENNSETTLGLNPNLIQRTPYELNATNDKFKDTWTAANTGVTATTVNLFGNGGEPITAENGCIYVIPTNQPIDVEIVYDVETINPKLLGKLSDGITPGLSIENKIRKSNVTTTKMQAGKFYTLNIHLGMTSVKVDAQVIDWNTDNENGNAQLPANQ